MKEPKTHKIFRESNLIPPTVCGLPDSTHREVTDFWEETTCANCLRLKSKFPPPKPYEQYDSGELKYVRKI
jgi:hypothetical protein